MLFIHVLCHELSLVVACDVLRHLSDGTLASCHTNAMVITETKQMQNIVLFQ